MDSIGVSILKAVIYEDSIEVMLSSFSQRPKEGYHDTRKLV